MENKRKAMKLSISSALLALILLVMIATVSSSQETATPNSFQQTISLLKSQKKSNSREFRQIKRELGVIKESISKPGITEILGGIGYIIGLFGLSYFWYAKNLLQKRA